VHNTRIPVLWSPSTGDPIVVTWCKIDDCESWIPPKGEHETHIHTNLLILNFNREWDLCMPIYKILKQVWVKVTCCYKRQAVKIQWKDNWCHPWMNTNVNYRE
jgi:hypothetical protein